MAFSISNPKESQARNSGKIFEGLLFKQGRYNRSWRTRWFVLHNTRKLAYYNDKKESIALKPIAEIDLTKVENIINDRSKDVQNKYVFEIVTSSRTFYLACLDMESLKLWQKYLLQMTFGTQIYAGWLIKKGDRIQTWKKRWFILSNLLELRYYENETEMKSKGVISLSNVSIIRHGNKEAYGYEYTIEIVTSNNKASTIVLVTTYNELRELWMQKLNEAMGGIQLNLLYKGWLWKFEENNDMPNWTKKFYGIDRETLNLYYAQSYNKFKQFASTLFFDKSYYENAVETQLQGNLPIKNSLVEQYGNDDARFDNTSQQSNPWIFRIRNVLGEQYFATDNELNMKEWIHHLNWAIGSGPDKVINKVTKGASNYTKSTGNTDNNRAKYFNESQTNTCDVIKMQQPQNANVILKMVHETRHESGEFRQNMPVINNVQSKPRSRPQTHVNTKYNTHLANNNFSKRELELLSKWNDIISSYNHSTLTLESEAQFPCNIEYVKSSEMHRKCVCVERISVIMNYYCMYWMNNKKTNKNLMGMSYLISILSDYSLTQLLNDFFHLKRFHAEDIANNHLIEPLMKYFIANYGECSMEECVSVTRNNLDYNKCKNDNILRKWYYIGDMEKSLESEEIATQQIFDMIHVYIFHGSYFSLYDTTSQNEIEYIRKIYETRKQKFNQNRYITNIYPYHHMPYETMDMELETPKESSDTSSHDTAQMYEYTQNAFGIDMQHNISQRAVKMYGPPKYAHFKQEILSHNKCSLSVTQFNIISLKARILLSSFECKLLKARKINDFGLTIELDSKLYLVNECMSEEMCQALLIYGNCEELRCEIMNTYFKMTHINETENDCRHRHYNMFYNWGKLLYTAIILFGSDIYNDVNDNNNNNKTTQKFYYHNISKPILFNKFTTTFYSPISCTNSRNVALIHMPTATRDGIILELDTNNMSMGNTPFYFNLSIFSNNPSECEQLFHNGISLGIHNIISVNRNKELSNLSNYTSAITLLRYIIGDANINNSYDNNEYTQQILDEFDSNICKHLQWLIDNQVNIYKNNKNINDYKNLSSNVPLYIGIILNSFCLHKSGVIQFNMNLLRKLPKPLQHKFVYQSPNNLNHYTINYKVIFNLFPNCSKIWKKGLYFNDYLCEEYVNFLCSEHITSTKYKIDGIVFNCTAETDWKLWVSSAKKHSSIIKQMGWLITASPPKKNANGRVSFIKRMNTKSIQQKSEKQILEKERLEKEKMERQRLEKERLEQKKLERERFEKQQMEQQKLEKRRLKSLNEQTDKEITYEIKVDKQAININSQIVSELEDIVNEEMENMLLIRSQFNEFKQQLLYGQTSQYGAGAVTCPQMNGSNSQTTQNNKINNGFNGNNNNNEKYNNSNGNHRNNNNRNNNRNDKNRPNKPNQYMKAKTTSMRCNHLNGCNDCMETVKYWQNVVAGQAQHIQQQIETHLSFQRLLAKAIANTHNTNNTNISVKKSNKKKQRLKSDQMHVRKNNEVNLDPIVSFHDSNNKTYISNKIIKHITQNVIKVPENPRNFMNASIEWQQNKEENKCNHKVMDFGFMDKQTNENLYGLLIRQNNVNYKWKMEDKLFIAKELLQFGLSPPKSSMNTNWKFTDKKYVHKMKSKMNTKSIAKMVNKCKWNKLPVFVRKNNEQRMTLSITPEHLNRQIKKTNANNIRLIPIAARNNNKNNVDVVWIVSVDKNINIGLSLQYNQQNDSIQINGIHVDKFFLLEQHYLLSPYHMNECQCLNGFTSIIHDIHIGNPDDLQNKAKDYKQRYETLKQFYNSFRDENETKESKESLQNSAEIIMNMHDNGYLFTDITTTPPVVSSAASSVSINSICPSITPTSPNPNDMSHNNYVAINQNHMSLPSNNINGYTANMLPTIINIPQPYVNNTNYLMSQQVNNIPNNLNSNTSYPNANNFGFNFQ